jgi:hypothetical protein
MARGWESKSVESQQEEAGRDKLSTPGRELTPEERATDQRRRTLLLARARTSSDLEKATRPVQRQMLRLGLAAIDSELVSLEAHRSRPGA